MSDLLRMFGAEKYKGTRNYINSQKKYEILRTILYFILPLGLFVIGYVTTKQRANLFTVVAVVGCLPACKSLVGMIMYLRYNSCKKETADEIDAHTGRLNGLYDLVFTSYKQNFVVSHIVVQGNNICGYSENKSFQEKEFQAHLDDILKLDGHKNYSVKIFTDLSKYTDRLKQLNELETENKYVDAVLTTLKSVVL